MDEQAFGKQQLDKVLEAVARQRSLPASALAVQSTLDVSGDPDRAVHELSQIVLDDPILTERVLRAANSAAQGVSGGVRTVTQAVVVLGFDSIRTIALSLTILEHIDSQQQRDLLRIELAHAVAAACVARELAAESGYEIEQAAVLALMRSMGRIVVAAWAPEAYLAIRTRARRDGLSEAQAARRLLGRPFHAVAQAAARAWGFDDGFAGPIGREPEHCRGHEFAAAVASQIIEAGARAGSLQASGVQAMVDAAAGTLGVPVDRVQRALQSARERIEQVCGVMGVPDPLDTESFAVLDHIRLDMAAAATVPPARERDAARRPVNYRDVLVSGLAALSEAALRGDPPEDLFERALDTMHRGMGFQRSLFALREPAAGVYRPRLVQGADADAIRRRWTLAADERNLFNAAIGRDVALNIADASADKVRAALPGGFARALPHAASFVLLPMCDGTVPMGFFYADRDVVDSLTGAEDIRLLAALKNQVLLAIRARG